MIKTIQINVSPISHHFIPRFYTQFGISNITISIKLQVRKSVLLREFAIEHNITYLCMKIMAYHIYATTLATNMIA